MVSQLTSIESLRQKVHEYSKANDGVYSAASRILDQIINTYNMDLYIEIEAQHLGSYIAAKDLISDERKFFDLPFWIYNKARLTVLMGLQVMPSQKILDVGSGAGHFMLINQMLGHHVHGIDIPHPVFDDIFNFFRLERTDHTILPFVPLPKTKMKFDLMTAFYVNFNTDHYTRSDVDRGKTAWGIEEWDFFLTDVTTNILSKDGSIFMLLNPVTSAETGLRDADGSLLNYFKDIGATIVNEEIRIVKISTLDAFRS